ncbi:MAG: CheR family methyltransferase [Bosea sp. (in: a-proteobacteria)]
MNESEFQYLRDMLHKKSGLSLTVEKKYLVESRLGSLCRRRKIDSISELVRMIRFGSTHELESAVIEAMTSNETLFFRDRVPFELFKNIVLPEALERNRTSRTLRIWSAAVSTGQEAYSLAMILDDMSAQLAGWRIDIVGTDISEEVLQKARAGLYSQFEMQRGLPTPMLLKHFTQDSDQWRISQKLRNMVQLKRLNLLEDTSSLGTFDIIFCRNVLIYFDIITKAKVMGELARRLKPEGALLLGAAETVIGICDAFTPDRVNRGLYRPTDPKAANVVLPLAPRLLAAQAQRV